MTLNLSYSFHAKFQNQELRYMYVLVFMNILEGVELIISFVDILLSFSSEECSL